MGLLDSAKERLGSGFEAFGQKFIAVLPKEPPDMRSALNKNDYPGGFVVTEIRNQQELKPEEGYGIKLIGTMMPHQPFTFGGTQKIVKDYYPGYAEPTVHVLGPQEENVTIKGRLYTKRIKAPPPPSGPLDLKKVGDSINGAVDALNPFSDKEGGASGAAKKKEQEDKRDFYRFAMAVQEQIEAIRVRGHLLKLQMGEWQRYGFMESATFEMKTIGDISYSINFIIIGFRPPTNCKILKYQGTIPFDKNKELIAAVSTMMEKKDIVPANMPKSFGDQIRDGIDSVAKIVNTATAFVDVVMNEYDDIKSAAERAIGLYKNCLAYVSKTQRRIGNYSGYTSKISALNGSASKVTTGYNNSNYLDSVMVSMFSIKLLLLQLRDQMKVVAATAPLARHRVVFGDTLQKIAFKYYNDDSKWTAIYDHNKLQDTVLVVGAVLEIPRA